MGQIHKPIRNMFHLLAKAKFFQDREKNFEVIILLAADNIKRPVYFVILEFHFCQSHVLYYIKSSAILPQKDFFSKPLFIEIYFFFSGVFSLPHFLYASIDLHM